MSLYHFQASAFLWEIQQKQVLVFRLEKLFSNELIATLFVQALGPEVIFLGGEKDSSLTMPARLRGGKIHEPSFKAHALVSVPDPDSEPDDLSCLIPEEQVAYHDFTAVSLDCGHIPQDIRLTKFFLRRQPDSRFIVIGMGIDEILHFLRRGLEKVIDQFRIPSGKRLLVNSLFGRPASIKSLLPGSSLINP